MHASHVQPQAWTQAFTRDPASVALARNWVRERCREFGVTGDALDSAELLAGEVAANAARHGGGTDMRVTCRIPDCAHVRVEVFDHSPRQPVRRQAKDIDVDGRGLAILAACAETWGVEPSPPGKVVYFELACGRQP